ncbi:MAG: GNAT family N-acetyltransferase, partial [Nitrososphaerota archaeon]
KHLQIINSNPFHKIIVAKHRDKIVGSITILIEPKMIHNLSYVAHIEDVVVDKDYRNRGIGKLLMNEAIKIAHIHHCYKIILNCAEDREEFYRKYGFFRKEIQMAYYVNKKSLL